ncbi:DUF1631 family protein [Marinobacter sediminum]|uniref:DUF1631 family protein n=1 Tax=Marinobacter sediminum TaxID=256323 RepID=UPI00202ED083|nr:DUF1631 family protein [Marinobacter sediminum]MCM0611279.1 DUF1631 family protein [Marinobacter sediminum]
MSSDQSRNAKLTMDVILVAQGTPPCGCIVSDVSMLNNQVILSLGELTSPSISHQLADGHSHQTELHICRLTDSEEQHLHLKGKARWEKEQGLTFRTQSEQPVSDALQTLEHGSRQTQLLGNGAAIESLGRLYRQHSICLLESLLAEFVENARDGIEKDLDNAAEVREITRLKDMRFIFNSRQSQIFQDFEARFSATSADLTTEPGRSDKSNELHLLQQHVFEDWLGLQIVASRLAENHSNTLFALNQLLNRIFRRDVSDSNNPLSPRSLCVCLQYAVDRLGISREHRQTIYHAFEIALNEIWPTATQSLIHECTRAGLRTLNYSDLPANWSLREEASSEDLQKDDTAADEHPLSGDDTDTVGEAETDPQKTPDQSIFRLMGLQHSPDASPGGWHKSSPQFCENLKPKRADLLDKLRTDQPEISRAIRELADNDPDLGSSLDQQTLEKANLVDQLFAPLKGQNGLSDALRNELEQLRLPVFEELLNTPGFLNEKDHPAREIVNNLMKLSFADRISTKSLESTVSAIIGELVQSETEDPDRLKDLNHKLKKLVERQDQSFLRNSERLAKALEGKERLKNTRKQVQQQLNTLLAGKEVPVVLMDLLESGWEQLMVLALLREGPESPHHEELMEVVILLQEWLSPGGHHEERAFERELESGTVLKFIDRELRSVGDIARFQSVMAELTDQIRHQKKARTVMVDHYGEEPDQQTPPSEPEENRWAQRARSLGAGDWVELALDSGERRRIRMVWGGEDVLRFVFLSPKGMSEISYEFSEFVQKLATGEAWIVDEGEVPFVDQSLFNIVQNVYQRLNFQATHDALTGCMYRHDFEKHLAGLLTENPDNSAGALIVLDIDEFSVINASYGAQAGDALLKATGQLIQRHVEHRESETYLGRISGNEFAILLGNTSIEECLDFAEILRRDFEEQTFSHGDAEFSVTISSCVYPITINAGSAGDLLNRSSLSLKSVKRLGGNRTELLRETPDESRPATPQWVSEIDRSIRDGSLYLRAQPIVPLHDSPGTGKSYELLLGMRNASGNEVSPQNYIEAAEKFRRSTLVDLWVVEEVLGWMNDNRETLAGIDTLNVNLSGCSLSDDTFMLKLESILRQNRSHTPRICFEVTETSAVSNLHYAADFMREMQRLECRFALDDFGTGMSSYAYLQKLPVDYVKIDGTFVRDMATNLTNYAMVRSINELCHFLDLKTIAEYVENLEIIESLREIQVDFAQGYGIAKPRRLDSLKNEKTAYTGFCV